jgi:predicted RNA binding protein YcfA (HicA-like mRNA interferase family)
LSRLPRISGRQAVQALAKVGYELDRQRGSHMILRQTRLPNRRLVIPEHRELPKGTLRAVIRQAGLTVDEFLALL